MTGEAEQRSLRRAQEKGLVLLGCGRMGGALLRGWLRQGIPPAAIEIHDPHPAPWLLSLAGWGARINPPVRRARAAAAILAVKPQIMEEAAPSLRTLADSGTVMLSIAAGTPIAFFRRLYGARARIVRAMPNLPASIDAGARALCGSENCDR